MSNNPFSIYNLFGIEPINISDKYDLGNTNSQYFGFNLLKQSLNNDTNLFDLDNILKLEKSHIQLFPKKENNLPLEEDSQENENEIKNKINFFKDSFFNQILSNEETKLIYEKINSNKKFKTKFNIDRNNSSVFFTNIILKNLNEGNKMKNLRENLNNQIENISQFQKENIALISTIYQAPKEIKEIKYFRKIKPNGDSFYISFIYQYVRNFIIEGDSSIISRILNLEREYHILNPMEDNLMDIGKNYMEKTEASQIKDLKNLEQAYIYLGIIYNLIEVENDINNAIKIFDLAFFYDKFFWKLLCLFMKSYIKDFLRQNSDIFIWDEYCNKNNLIPKKYFSGKNHIFNYEFYVNDNIIINQKEPTLFIISIIPYVFDINLNLYINEEGSKNPDDIYKIDKITLINSDPENKDEKNDINILYTGYSYHIIECNNEGNIDKNIEIKYDKCNIFNFTLGNDAKIYEHKNEYIINIIKKCKKCNKGEYIIIKNIDINFPICLNCFKSIVDKVLIKRYQNMINEKFNYVEYYLNEIPLLYIENTNEYKYLSSIEFFYIFNQNIFTYFRNLINNTCDFCYKIFENKKIIHKTCYCKHCLKCAKNKCDILYFSNFEKNFIYKNEIIQCGCGIGMEKIKYGSQIFNMLNTNEKIECEKEVEKRKKDLAKKYCMGCGVKLDKNIIGKNKKIFHCYNFEIIDKNNNKEMIEHKLCKECEEKNEKIINEENKIYCIICDNRHIFNNNINTTTKYELSASDKINKIEINSNIKIENNLNDKILNEKKEDKKDISENVQNDNNIEKEKEQKQDKYSKENKEENDITNEHKEEKKEKKEESKNTSEKTNENGIESIKPGKRKKDEGCISCNNKCIIF